MNEKYVAVAIITLLLSLSILASLSFRLAYGQSERRLPVLLIHGYASDASVWEKWENMLKNDRINASTVTFSEDDRCGNSESHAQQLHDIVRKFKTETGADQVNIVAHSKGGLDARVFLASNLSNDDVANLIMIGTPNLGSPLALGSLSVPPMMYPYLKDIICWPAVYDLIPGSAATNAVKNENTKYYTIAGNWIPSPYYYNFFYPFPDTNCPQPSWLPFERWAGDFVIYGSDDGIVPLWSAAPQGITNLGITPNCHTNLFGEEEYVMARSILLELE